MFSLFSVEALLEFVGDVVRRCHGGSPGSDGALPYQLILPFFGIERIPEAVSEKIQGKERQRKEECGAKQ
jgi:hypothetical protein